MCAHQFPPLTNMASNLAQHPAQHPAYVDMLHRIPQGQLSTTEAQVSLLGFDADGGHNIRLRGAVHTGLQ